MNAVQTKAFVIYLLGPCPEGRFYVGQTEDLRRRLADHQRADGRCPELHRAIKKFGWDAFQIRILEETDLSDEADRLERLQIVKYNALIPHGYNMTLGGRATLFDPNARVDGFEEQPVSEEEFRRMAYEMTLPDVADRWHVSCCVCGELTNWNMGLARCGCGVTPEFGQFILRHLADGGTVDSLPLIEDLKLLERWQESDDADVFIDAEVRNLRIVRRSAGDKKRVKDDEVLPVAACKHGQRFITHAATWVRRNVLAKKGLPFRRPGRFIAVPGGQNRARLVWGIEDYVRENRENWADPVRRMRDCVFNLKRGGKFRRTNWPAVEEVLQRLGASDDELRQAKLQADFEYGYEWVLKRSGISALRAFAGDMYMGARKAEVRVLPESGDNVGKLYVAEFDDEKAWRELLEQLLALPAKSRNSCATRLLQDPPRGVSVTVKDPAEEAMIIVTSSDAPGGEARIGFHVSMGVRKPLSA